MKKQGVISISPRYVKQDAEKFKWFKLAIPRSSLRGDRLGSPFRKGG
jgi:hypothetical protein